ncbi:signaling threshold-regulating transmembrane adapter 1 isoform X2 [Protopterus annectens]|nr:signaling threshold-regulating transmembrane adapter 1 isoform X2 [Protopterus annectens]
MKDNGKCFRSMQRSNEEEDKHHVYDNIHYLHREAGNGITPPFECEETQQQCEQQERMDKVLCYANLQQNPPKCQKKKKKKKICTTQIEYTDVITVNMNPPEKENWEKLASENRSSLTVTGDVRPVSGLYASVHPKRYNTLFTDENYANNQ